MSYEQTDQDGLYIEDSYFTPDGYYVYVAEAQAAMAVTGGLSADVGVIKSMAVAMSVTTTVVASLANIQGVEMFAFSDAALAADVQRIRDYNVAASSQFSIAIDAVRGIYVSAQADSIASLSADFLRARTGEAAISAAFSVSTTAENIKGFDATLTSSASLTTSVENIKQFDSSVSSLATQTVSIDVVKGFNASLSSSLTLTAIISHIEGADLQAFTNASLTVDSQVTKEISVALTTAFTSTTAVIKSVTASTSISAVSSIRICGGVRYERPLVAESLNNVGINTSIKKFGQGSLQLQTGSGYINYYATKDLVAQGNPANTGDEFLLEFWHYSPGGVANRTLLEYTNSAGTQRYWSFGYGANAYLEFIISGPSLNAPNTSSTTLPANQWNHIAVSFSTGFGAGGISIWLNGTRIYNNSYVPIPPTPPDLGLLRIGNRATTGLIGYIDDLRVATAYHGSNTLIDIGRSPSSSTITVPTDRLYNDDAYTRFLGHFDLDYCDDVSDIESATATLTSAFTVTADVRKFGLVTADASLSSQASLSGQATRVHPGSADLSAEGFLISAFGRIRPFVDASAGEFTLAADLSILSSAAANLSSSTTVSATVTKNIGPITSDMLAQAALSATAQTTNGAQAQLVSEGFLVAAFGRIRPFVDASAGEFSLVASAAVTSEAAAGLSSVATQTTSIVKTIGPITANLSSAFTQTATATTIPSGSTFMSVLATQFATPNRLRDHTVTANSSSSLSADAQIVSASASALASAFSQTALVTRIKPLDAQLPSIASELVAINKIGNVLVDMSLSSQMTTAAVARPSGSVDMSALTTSTATALRIKSSTVSMSAQAQVTVNATTSIDITVNLTTAVSATIVARKTASAQLNLPSPAFGLTATVGLTKQGITLVASGGTMTTTATAVKRIQKALTTLTTMTVIAGKSAEAGASLQVTAFTLITGRELRLDPDLTYVVPKEYRSYKIRRESRAYIVPEESRTYKVRGN